MRNARIVGRLTARGLDKKSALIRAIKMVKEDKITISEKVPIQGEEFSKIWKCVSEESKEASIAEVEGRLKEVFSDPVALAQSFGPPHVAMALDNEAPVELDSRAFGFMKKLFEILNQDPDKQQDFFDTAISGFNRAQKAQPLPASVICKFFLLTIGNDALFDPTHMPFIITACTAFNEIKDFDKEANADFF